MTMRWSSAAKSMLPGNAKCSMTYRYMTSLADTKHIFIERFMAHRLAHRILHQPRSQGSLLPAPWSERGAGRREPWERGWFCIWLRPRAVHVMHARLAHDEIMNSLRENKRISNLSSSEFNLTNICKVCLLKLNTNMRNYYMADPASEQYDTNPV